MRKTGLVANPLFCRHDPGFGHPESPERFQAVMQALEDAGLLDSLARITGRKATRQELGLCHCSDYLSIVEHEILTGAAELFTGDTSVCEHSWEVAVEAVGSVLCAVDAVFKREVDNAFCVVRPPGHHATPNRGMGFCIFNNVAIAARYAQKQHGIERVLIVDWDVHHGNGTQDIFYQDGSVFFFSTHQFPSYPGTGSAEETGFGPGVGTTLNFPFRAGAGREEILGVFETRLVVAMKRFRPELVLISAGFDSRIHDPLGGFTLKDRDFFDLTREVMAIADEHSQGRLVSVLEGGYNLSGLGSAAVAHVQALLGHSPETPAPLQAGKANPRANPPSVSVS